MMAEDGIQDFSHAKRKAARQIGADAAHFMPDNDEIEAELRAYQALFQSEEHGERIRRLRSVALEAMRLLSRFRPYLSGPVLKGTAGRYAEVELQVYTDDPKALEFLLLERKIAYEAAQKRHSLPDGERAIPSFSFDWNGVPVTVAVHSVNDERINRTTAGGKPIERAGLTAVEDLLADRE